MIADVPGFPDVGWIDSVASLSSSTDGICLSTGSSSYIASISATGGDPSGSVTVTSQA